ncbi:NAD(P)/FAD-dependent oxidoreductase [Amycolatopsis thermoflava]|uniref:NAD(P)/FAD-dependent oxidoreductase n=1 Tax=Amycolatopsis thermoflava TaxID=84480 RepID=UPI003658653D
MSVLVVGASVAGVRTVQALRARGWRDEVTLIGEEPHSPYDKPPLSKEMLDPSSDGGRVPLVGADELTALEVDLRLGVRAVRLDPARRVVTGGDGAELGYDTLVIATGVVPRTLPGAESLSNVFTLRTAEDAAALRRELRPGRRAVVVGAGFIGAEFAAAARAHDVEVTLVEAQEVPLEQQLGAEVGAMLSRLHERNGVALRCGVRFAGFVGSRRATTVALSDGTELPADFVVVGIGARPATDWLTGSGLPVPDGVDCDESLRVIGFPDVYAAGDVARWRHPFYREPLRVEHWTNANDHAAVVAAAVLGAPPPRAPLPYVWSDQYGRRIQIIGRPALGSPVILRAGRDGDGLVAGYADDAGVLVGALVLDDPRLLMKFRKAIIAARHAEEFERAVLPAA